MSAPSPSPKVISHLKLRGFILSTLPLFIIVFLLTIFYLPVFPDKIPLSADVITTKFFPINATSTVTNQAPHNELTTDPVRQLYPWRHLAIQELKAGNLPWWNPFNLASTPLLANFQSAVFYPGNIIFWFTDFATGWTFLVISQQLLGSMFLYLFLRHHHLSQTASLFGSVTWIFSGFFIAWLQWNTLVHVAIWCPLILLSFDHLMSTTPHAKLWSLILVVALSSQFFAGSPGPWLYLSLLQISYLFIFYHHRLLRQKALPILIGYLTFAIIILPQFAATWQFASLSNRTADIGNPLTDPTWFLPLQHLAQLIVPNFFGNPISHNYWGVFNYTEFLSYIGVIPLFFVLYLIGAKKFNGLPLFFIAATTISLLLATKNPLSELQVKLSIPLVNTSNASRWLVVTDFSLALLSAFGLEQFVNKPSRKSAIRSLSFIAIIIVGLWISTFINSLVSPTNQLVARSSLLLPTVQLIIVIGMVCLLLDRSKITKLLPAFKKLTKPTHILMTIVTASFIPALSLASQYTSFSPRSDLYPPSQITTYLHNQPGYYRYLTLDKNILPAAINVEYGLYTIEGYDSLYVGGYGQLLASADNTSGASFAFHRQPGLTDYKSPIANLLGVKYILSFNSIPDNHLTLLMQEGFVNLYQNNLVFPRAFVTASTTIPRIQEVESADIITYQPNYIKIITHQTGAGYLVLSDSYYPGWTATLDGQPTEIINWHHLRATIVPEGDHELIYQYRYPQL